MYGSIASGAGESGGRESWWDALTRCKSPRTTATLYQSSAVSLCRSSLYSWRSVWMNCGQPRPDATILCEPHLAQEQPVANGLNVSC